MDLNLELMAAVPLPDKVQRRAHEVREECVKLFCDSQILLKKSVYRFFVPPGSCSNTV